VIVADFTHPIYSEHEILLDVQQVNKSYGSKLVLKNVNATIRDIRVAGEVKGQVVGFIGPSGIGKTTLVRIMAGLDSASSGQVVLDGSAQPVRAGDVGLVAQSYPLFNDLTVHANLMVAARKSIKDSRDAQAKVVSYLADFDLTLEADLYPSQLSGGQRQRVAILQQILAGHTSLFMDEPFSGLDPVAKRKVQALIQRVANLDERNSIVIVSHDITAVAACCDHIWIMGRDKDAQGRVVPGAYIVMTYNLIDIDLAWDPFILDNPKLVKFVREIDGKFGEL
jgi:ABC-type nitrate/sulfonate/bicarbonate transport system ATPase subunit